MNHSGTCITNGPTNNSVVIIQKSVHQRGNVINDDTEEDSEDDMYEDDDMDCQSVDESVNANEEKITSQLGLKTIILKNILNNASFYTIYNSSETRIIRKAYHLDVFLYIK